MSKKKLSRRMRLMSTYTEVNTLYSILDGLELLKKITKVNFTESVDVAIRLGVDARKSEQNVRGSVVMPNGIGRNVFVVVFTQGENLKLAKNAGADLVGLEDLFVPIKKGEYKLDVVIATADVMNIVSKLGTVLGPKGLMPNPKMGTVSQDIVESVKNFKLGQIRYRNDRSGIIHAAIGKIDFHPIKLKENLEALLSSLQQIKPVSCKGPYIKQVTLSTTMSRSIMIDHNSLCCEIS